MSKKLTTKTKLPKPFTVAPAYTISDPIFGSLDIKGSANGWWLDSIKLNELIKAFKYDATIEEACIVAGITLAQYKYFASEHPDFSAVIEACRNLPTLTARKSVVEALPKDPNLSFKYLERKRPTEFGQKVPTVAVQINMGDRMANKKAEYEQ